MKPYPEYKDSGVEWIGEVPSSWGLVKIKFVSKVISGSTPKSSMEEYWDGDIKWITPTDIGEVNNKKYLHATRRSISEKGLKSCGCSILPKRSVVLTNRGPIGNVIIPSFDFTTNQGCKAIISNKSLSSDYLFYLLKMNQNVLESLGNGTTFMELSTTSLENFEITFPSYREQNQIVSFLDHKTQLIDDLIEKTEKKIELLKEKRTALINHCVTKGLNPDAEMKDSGVEWIGKIPSGWELDKLKYFSSLIIDKESTNKSDIKISPENVESYTGKCLNFYSEYEGKGVPFKPGDILLNKLRLYLTKILLSEHEGYSMGEMLVIRTNKSVSSKYYYYLFFNQGLISFWESQSTGVKVPRVAPEIIMGSYLPYPSPVEKKQIVAYLDEQTQIIDSTIEKETQRIALLKEYRQSLISAAVTGKIDVRDWNK